MWAGFYSPVIDHDALPPSFWNRPDPMPGLRLDLDAQLHFLERELLGHVRSLDVPISAPAGGGSLYVDNPYYGPFDAQVLYAMVRRSQPRRVLELGSGFSSLFIDRALADAGCDAEHVIVDPFPSPVLADLSRSAELEITSAALLAPERFAALQADDVLFVDTSHTVKPGGEVLPIVLEVLTELNPGVVIHFHDIFRPYPYPRVLYEAFGHQWQEQYLLQALLAYNPRFEVLCANHALWRDRRAAVHGWFPGLQDWMEPSGFWFRRALR